MTHKEKLEHWKKNDPIHYYEMTSDPTGSNGSDGFWFEFCLVLIIVVALVFIYVF